MNEKFKVMSIEELFEELSRRERLVIEGKRKLSNKIKLQLRPE